MRLETNQNYYYELKGEWDVHSADELDVSWVTAMDMWVDISMD